MFETVYQYDLKILVSRVVNVQKVLGIMKYYINGRFLSQKVTGVQRYAREMILALDEILQVQQKSIEMEILAPGNAVNDLGCKKIFFRTVGNMTGHLWEQIELSYYARNGYLINFCNCAPLMKRNQTVTIHDAVVKAIPNTVSWKFRFWYRIMHYVLGKRLEKILTVSNFSKRELNKYFHIPLDRIFITYNGREHLERIKEDNGIIKRLDLDGKRFVLAVSTKNPSKNFGLILSAAKQMPNTLFIIAGGENKTVFKASHREALPNVKYAGYVSDEELVALYRHAYVFAYPSFYEGFGIPPLEALQQGCPVILSDGGSLPEIYGKGALYCNPYDMQDLVCCIEQLVTNEDERTKMIALGRQQISQYSWKKSAKVLYDLIC